MAHVAHGVVGVVAGPEEIVGAAVGAVALDDAEGAEAVADGVGWARPAFGWRPAAVLLVGRVVGGEVYDAVVGKDAVCAAGEKIAGGEY